jgi:Ku C terminal domain like
VCCCLQGLFGPGLVNEVGSVDPVGNFFALLARRDKDMLSVAIPGLQKQIERYAADGSLAYRTKAIECLTALRKGCLEVDYATVTTLFCGDLGSPRVSNSVPPELRRVSVQRVLAQAEAREVTRARKYRDDVMIEDRHPLPLCECMRRDCMPVLGGIEGPS